MKSLKLGLATLALLLGFNIAHADGLKAVIDETETIKYEELNQPLKNAVDKELKCLAKNIYHEAGSESFEGKVAVAMVSINRAESGKFPDSICGVVSQRTTIADKIICQFSWFCTSKRNSQPRLNERWIEAMEVAKMVLLEGYRIPRLENALYFHASYVRPGWRLPKVAKIGNHIFYSDKLASAR